VIEKKSQKAKNAGQLTSSRKEDRSISFAGMIEVLHDIASRQYLFWVCVTSTHRGDQDGSQRLAGSIEYHAIGKARSNRILIAALVSLFLILNYPGRINRDCPMAVLWPLVSTLIRYLQVVPGIWIATVSRRNGHSTEPETV
jgi:hypothetical protein